MHPKGDGLKRKSVIEMNIVKSMFLARVRSPGYVKTYRQRVKVPCENYHHPDVGHTHGDVDDNSCIEGGVLGGIGGAAAGAALSRGDGRLWAIPLGIVGGAMVGCQVDGG